MIMKYTDEQICIFRKLEFHHLNQGHHYSFTILNPSPTSAITFTLMGGDGPYVQNARERTLSESPPTVVV